MADGVQLISERLIDELRAKAIESPRGRVNRNFHAGADDAVHRFLNVLTRGTYVQPHRHFHPPKHESFIVLEGTVAVIAFNDDGEVLQRWNLTAEPGGNRGIDFPAGLWHTIAALTDTAVCFEVKPGPWDPATDKEFAAWAPAETHGGAARAWLDALLESTSAF